jgi:hypothetical protein
MDVQGTAGGAGRRSGRDGSLVWVWLVVGVTALLDLVGLFSMVTGLVLVNGLQGDASSHQRLTALPQILQADLCVGATGDLTTASIWLRLLSATPTLVNLVTVLLAGAVIVRIIGGIRAGLSFEPAMLRWWGRLSGTLIVGGLAQALASVGSLLFLSSTASLGVENSAFGGAYCSISWSFPDIPWVLIMLGVIALALAMAFVRGAELQEEAEGVV